MCLLFAAFLAVAWSLDNRRLPLLDVGAFVVFSTTVYSVVPAIQWLANGQQWSYVSDRRLLLAGIGAPDLEQYLTGAIIYLACFGVVYLATRGSGRPQQLQPTIRLSQVVAVLAVYCGALVFRFSVEQVYGFSFYQSDVALASGNSTQHLPLLIQQLTHNIVDIGRDALLALVVVLVAFWNRLTAKLLLATIFCHEIIDIVLRMGQRTSVVLLFMGAILAYHRMVRPIRLVTISTATAGVLCLTTLYGIYRDVDAAIYKFDVSFSNEFQVLFGTFAHLQHLFRLDKIATVPWQIYVSDALMLIPQQILPIQKIDPSLWYIEKANLSDSGGFMFGLMSEAAAGGGYLELAARGLALGTVLGLIHRMFVRRSESFWITVFYIWLCTVIYYAFRASTFYWVAFLVFQFLPLLLFSRFVSAAWKIAFDSDPIINVPEHARCAVNGNA
jgi:hypothetical protein